jgi:hypothetical protein
MIDFTLVRVVYGAFSIVLVAALMFVLTRGLRKTRYIRPVLIGFIFGMGCAVMFGAGIFGLFMGGVLAGYLFASEVGVWGKHMRAGGLAGVLFMPNICFETAYGVEVTTAKLAEELGRLPSTSELLAWMCGETFISAIFFIAVLGIGAILGGFLRKALKPREPKSSSVAG